MATVLSYATISLIVIGSTIRMLAQHIGHFKNQSIKNNLSMITYPEFQVAGMTSGDDGDDVLLGNMDDTDITLATYVVQYYFASASSL